MTIILLTMAILLAAFELAIFYFNITVGFRRKSPRWRKIGIMSTIIARWSIALLHLAFELGIGWTVLIVLIGAAQLAIMLNVPPDDWWRKRRRRLRGAIKSAIDRLRARWASPVPALDGV